MQHLRLGVELLAGAVAAELAHHAVAMAFHVLLDRMTDIAQARARLDLLDADPHRFVGDAQQASDKGLYRRFTTDDEHAAAIAVPAVGGRRDVDVDDVAFFQGLVIRDAVADLVVDRGADRLGVGRMAGRGIVQRCRHRTARGGVFGAQAIQLVGGHAGHDKRRDVVEQLGGKAAGNAHVFDFFGGMDLDAHGRNYPRNASLSQAAGNVGLAQQADKPALCIYNPILAGAMPAPRPRCL